MITIAYLSKANQVRSNTPHRKRSKPKPNHRLKTPIPEGPKICYACGKTKYLEIHHVYPSSNRENSSKYKCVAWLCYNHHRGQPEGVHGGNEKLDQMLKKDHQLKLIQDGMSIDEFIEIFGRNYL